MRSKGTSTTGLPRRTSRGGEGSGWSGSGAWARRASARRRVTSWFTFERGKRDSPFVGNHGDLDEAAAPQRLRLERAADGGCIEDPVHLVDVLHRLAVEEDEDVARAQAGLRGGSARPGFPELHA